jgi:hypothetical protein
MKKLIKFGVMSAALGVVLVAADTADAQYRRDNNRREERREMREEIREARRDYRDDLRDGDNRRRARREYRREVREARQDYRRDVRRGRDGWYWYQNGRRYTRPFSQWNYRNGWFYRLY